MPIDLVPIIQFVGYPGIFTIIFLESGVFFAFFLPGASLLFTAGLLASQGFFNPWILIPGVIIAAVAGDNVGYWFGKKYGVKLFLRPDSRFFKHEHLARAKAFYDKFGNRTILFARFIPIIRTFAPIIAGIVQMDYKKFLLYNVIGASVWAGGVTSLAYFLGARIPGIADYLGYIIIGIIAITSIPILIDTWRNRHTF